MQRGRPIIHCQLKSKYKLCSSTAVEWWRIYDHNWRLETVAVVRNRNAVRFNKSVKLERCSLLFSFVMLLHTMSSQSICTRRLCIFRCIICIAYSHWLHSFDFWNVGICRWQNASMTKPGDKFNKIVQWSNPAYSLHGRILLVNCSESGTGEMSNVS